MSMVAPPPAPLLGFELGGSSPLPAAPADDPGAPLSSPRSATFLAPPGLDPVPPCAAVAAAPPLAPVPPLAPLPPPSEGGEEHAPLMHSAPPGQTTAEQGSLQTPSSQLCPAGHCLPAQDGSTSAGQLGRDT